MISAATPRVLVLYSNPGDSQRLRLDKEHRAIDAVLRELGLDSSVVLRRHAVSVEDFSAAIRSGEFEIIQFSGHGSEEGIVLERQPTGKKELVDASRLTAALSGDAERLAGARAGPDGPSFGPLGEPQRKGPAPDSGEEMTLFMVKLIGL